MKKTTLLLVSCTFAVGVCFAQSPTTANNIGINTVSPDSTAVLDIVSNDKGILIPRLTESQRDSIQNPATGLLIFQMDSTNLGFYFFNGIKWESINNQKGSDNATLIYTTDGF